MKCLYFLLLICFYSRSCAKISDLEHSGIISPFKLCGSLFHFSYKNVDPSYKNYPLYLMIRSNLTKTINHIISHRHWLKFLKCIQLFIYIYLQDERGDIRMK